MTNDRFTLEATDFGPLASARVELRPLTVFVGPSNTGKSWLATLLYALHSHFGRARKRWTPWDPMGPGEEKLTEHALADLVRIAEGWTDTNPVAVRRVVLTEPVRRAIESHLETHTDAIGEEVERCFGVESGSHLIRTGAASGTRIQLRHGVEGSSATAVHSVTFAAGTWAFRPSVPACIQVRGRHYLRRLAKSGADEERTRSSRAWEAIRGALARDVLPLCRPAFYLPADRTGLMNAHSVIVSALIRSATRAGIRGADPIPPISGVRGDFLEELVEMASSERRARGRGEPLRQLGARIEERILGGEVSVGSPGVPHPHFTYLPREWKSGIPLTTASSMVSEIAPVVLYLRHVVAAGDLLIIDEPESHLHPAMQVAFTRLIAEIAAAGVQVVVTTHSEWVLEEVGNIVGRARLTDGGKEESGAVSLEAGDVGVWLFETGTDAGGSTVKEIALDTDTGLYPSGFDAVATALHNAWAEVADARGDAE